MQTWIRRPIPIAEPRARLLCFPHAGGAAGYYRPLAVALGEDVEVLAIQYPARQDRYGEPPALDAAEVVDAVLAELPHELPDDGRPFALFGHSMGAALAFETARRLERTGRLPAALFASAAQRPVQSASRTDRHLESDEEILGHLRRHGGTAAELLADQEFLSLTLTILRNDYLLLDRYEYVAGPLLDCPIVTLVGDSDPGVPVEDVTRWAAETRAECEFNVLAGGHFYLDTQIEKVVQIIRAGIRL